MLATVSVRGTSTSANRLISPSVPRLDITPLAPPRPRDVSISTAMLPSPIARKLHKWPRTRSSHGMIMSGRCFAIASRRLSTGDPWR